MKTDLREVPPEGSILGETMMTMPARATTRSTPFVAVTDPGKTRVAVNIMEASSQIDPINTLAHESAHVAQALGAPEVITKK